MPAGYILTPPGTAVCDVLTASAPFTVQLAATPGSAVTITPSDGGRGGTFTPASLSISDTTAHTFTYTPSLWGASTVNTTNSGGLTDPPGVTYTGRVQLGGGNSLGMTCPDLGGWEFFAPGDLWVADISNTTTYPTHARSPQILQAMTRDGQGNLLSTKLAILGDTTDYGFPYHVVPENTPLTLIPYDPIYGLTGFDGATSAPIPASLALEAVPYGNPLPTALDGNDHHALICVRDDTVGSQTYGGIKKAYELYSVYVPTPGGYTVSRFIYPYPGSGNRYDDRPEGFPATNAGGTRILPSIIRYDALRRAIAANGDLGCALRFDTQFVRNQFTAPARTGAGFSYPPGSDVMCCGTRLRLKASFDITPYSPGLKVILRTLKKYGMILDDTGGQFQLQATMDAAWGVRYTPYLTEIQLVDVIQNFEVIDFPHGYTMAFPGGTSGVLNQSATIAVGISPPATNIDPAHIAGLSFSDYFDAALTQPAGGTFTPYRVNYSNGDLGSKNVAYTPAGSAGPRYVLGTDNTIQRDTPPAVLYNYGTVSPPPGVTYLPLVTPGGTIVLKVP